MSFERISNHCRTIVYFFCLKKTHRPVEWIDAVDLVYDVVGVLRP